MVFVPANSVDHCRWLKDDRQLVSDDKYSIVNDARSGILSLTVIGATEADIGQYECEV